ncbi:hypothetical protein CRG98_019985 [Punica granatum]|uniref:Uncharacterized protein n=1 Tax=Punica granatum TaxID=22663 RepID=A0A2I0JVS8_PUNGR|nr:hypothetical protein CRG98_019985 [Punica granatum]
MPYPRCIINNNPPTQQAYYSAPPASFPSSVPQQYAHNYAPAPPPIQQSRPRLQEILSRCNGLRLRRTHRASQHKRGVNSSHLCRLCSPTYTGNSSRDQSRRCEYHQGALGHTTDNCWKLQERIQQMIDDKQLTFNAVKPPNKKVIEEEAEAFMKIIKASEYKVVEQMAKSPAHISLLALLLGSEPHREALLKVLTAAQIPKETAPERIEETISSIFSNNISFSDDELPSKGWAHSRALHIVCKCNNFIIGRVMIDNGSALNVCPVSTLKQMNMDFNRIRLSKTTVRAFDGSRREVNGEIDLVIEVGTLDGLSSDSDSELVDLPNICAVTEETTPGTYIRLAQENEELNNWTSIPRYSAVIADV